MIVGIAGAAGTGKSTLARALQNHEVLSFAKHLKSQVSRMLETLGKKPDWGNYAEKEKYRELLVTWGRLCRQEDKDYWIKKLYINNVNSFSANNRIVIDDVRYVNEAEWIHSKGGLIILLERTGINPREGEEEESLKELEKLPYVIVLKAGEPLVTLKNLRTIIHTTLTNKFV